MGAPIEFCNKKSVVAVLASGLVISLTALTGGMAPAFAKPDTDPVVPATTVVPEPEPEVKAPKETAEVETPAPETLPDPPSVQAPTQTQAPETQEPEPAPRVEEPTTQTAAPPVAPRTPVNPPATSAQPPAPRQLAPQTSDPEPQTSEPEPQTSEPEPEASTPQSPARLAPARTPAPVTTTAPPATPESPATSESPATAERETPPLPGLAPRTEESIKAPAGGSATPETDNESETSSGEENSAVESSSSSTVSQAAKVIKTAEAETLKAPQQDVQLARNAKAVEVKPAPAPDQDITYINNAIFVNGDNNKVRIDDRDNNDDSFNNTFNDNRRWDRKVRQWNRDWIEYDQFYRPIFFNPFRDPVRIVYVFDNRPRIAIIPALARIVLEVAQFAAYSFTAVVLSPFIAAANLAQAAVDVAVGSFFGGGFVPRIGQAFPSPPPVQRFDNVPVLVRYSDAVYEPFRVRRIVDMGDDARFGERKVLLDGATPAWGVWTQTATGERQFEVHRTQQFPGLEEPREAPLPGDYQLRLASDESSSGLDRRDMYLIAAAGAIAVLGFGAIGLAFFLGRRRPEH